MFVHGTTSFYVLRFALGVAEGGFFPGIVFYLSGWFPFEHRAGAVSRFMLAIPFATVISGLLASPLLAMQGTLGLAGWQWLFLLEGLPSAALGVVVLFLLPDGPATVPWLSLDEKRALAARLERERGPRHAGHGSGMRRYSRVAVRGVVGRHVSRGQRLYILGTATHPDVPRRGSWGDRPADRGAGRGKRSMHLRQRCAFGSDTGTVAAYCSAVHVRHFRVASRRVVTPSVARFGGLALAGVTVTSLYGPFWSLPSRFLEGQKSIGNLVPRERRRSQTGSPFSLT